MTGQLLIKNNRTKRKKERKKEKKGQGKKEKTKKGKKGEKKGHASTRIRLDSSDGAEILDL